MTHSFLRKRQHLLVIAMLLSTVTACKKQTEETTCTISQTSLSGTYKLTALKYKMTPTATEQDYMQFRETCEKDDEIELKADGSYTYKDQGTTCAPNGTDNGNWSLNGNTLTSDGMISGTISNFDCHTLVYYVSGVYTPGDKMIFTMVKQ